MNSDLLEEVFFVELGTRRGLGADVGGLGAVFLSGLTFSSSLEMYLYPKDKLAISLRTLILPGRVRIG